MSRWQRFKNWFRKAKPTPEIASEDALREFVYLDDVSVDSLVASAKGSILEQITQTTGSELQSEVGSTLGGNTPISTAEVRSRTQATTSDALQTLRRAGIQARFRELHKIVEGRLALRPPDDAEAVPVIVSVAELMALAANEGGSRWAVPERDLRRGRVLEVDVALGPEPLFHLVSAMTQILDMWPDDPNGVGLEELPDVGVAVGIGAMISHLLGGLVPIRARAVTLESVEVEGERWLIHRDLINQLPATTFRDRRPLMVVGVAAEDGFWKDQRRVLFAGAAYRILARIVVDGMSSTWMPVKMADTFKGLAPGFAEGLEEASRQGERLLNGQELAVEPTQPLEIAGGDTRMGALLIETFGRLLGERVGLVVSSSELAEAGLTADAPQALPSLEDSIAMLDPVANHVERRLGTPIDAIIVSETRLAARQYVHHDSASLPSILSVASLQSLTNPALLEVEFVAIYW